MLEKPYFQLKAPALLGYFWSSKAAKPVLEFSFLRFATTTLTLNMATSVLHSFLSSNK